MLKSKIFKMTIFLLCIVFIGVYTKTDTKAEGTAKIVNRVYMDKSRYNPGDSASISIDVSNTMGSDWSGKLNIDIMSNESIVYSTSKTIALGNGASNTITLNWNVPKDDYKGYMVKVYTGSNDFKTSAIDVSSSWTKFPRYGYIPDFDNTISKDDVNKQINSLTQDYYINSYQFYDWMWRHENPIKKSDGVNVDASWQDAFNRNITWSTIQNYINAVHSKNSTAMAYMMAYAARENYSSYGVSPAWGIYKYNNNTLGQINDPFVTGTSIWFFQPSNTNWQNYITNAYKDCINTGGFDGIQMDQIGEMDNVYDSNGNKYDLQNSFSSLVNAAKSKLKSNNPSKSYVDFNLVNGSVGGWAVDDVTDNANGDINFSELWDKASNYNDIKNYVQRLRSNKKGTVLAAYMNYYENLGKRYEAEDASFSGPDVANNHPGYSGTGFLENFAKVGDNVTFNISVDNDMTYALDFQYSSDADKATRTVYVDGNKIGQVNCQPQGGWDKYAFDASISTYLAKGNHTVKISYDSEDSGAINLDCLTLGEFDENSVRLADAAIQASGASHIEMGAGLDGAMMLPSEYYPNKSKVMSPTLREAMKQNNKFITAYENLLFDTDITYGDGGNQYISINNEAVSGDGTSGTIWHMTRMKNDYDILHLINLSSKTNSKWRDSTSTPKLKTNLNVKYYLSDTANISGVYVASPDSNEGLSQQLNYTEGTDNVGHYISFTVPSLQYWDMIYIKRNISTPSNNTYEAEGAIKTNVTTNTNHVGYTGSGFVDGFVNPGSEVTFQANIPQDGNYSLNFKYANCTGGNATRHVYIDGSYAGTINMANLKDWDTWGTSSVTAKLSSGIHTICICYDSSDKNAINLDNLSIN
ncbi:glycoside hydrolase family 66 protein [Clostridium neuense]|uniref:Glycoside hydrolase family 66 protein n=1 Tax=Clostridium neuense TaxID=1728934 RepID=A0ABW8TAN1_9CLOT